MDLAPLQEFSGFAIALGIGLLVGLEREQRRARGDAHPPAGIRTLAMISLAGAIAQRLGPVAFALAGAFVVLGAVVSYCFTRDEDRGLSTEVAMLLVFLLGALAMLEAGLAAALGVVVAVLLASKSRLHRFAQRVLTRQELHDGLLLAAAAVVVLPLLPDQAPDPWGVLNLHRLWTLVVLVMGINAAGYVALRALGPRAGLAITGLSGGFVSSVATIGSMGSRARLSPLTLPHCVSGALMSNVSTVVQLGILVAALSASLFKVLLLPLCAAGAVAVLAALAANWRSAQHALPEDAKLLPGRAFQPAHALLFAATVAGVLLASAAIQAWLGSGALTAALAVAGFADAHASAASAAQLVASGELTAEHAALPVLAAFTTNSITKLVVAASQGGKEFLLGLLPGIVSMNLTFAGLALFA